MVSPIRPRPTGRKKDRGQIKDFARGVRNARRAIGALTDGDLDKMTDELHAEMSDPEKNHGCKFKIRPKKAGREAPL